MTSLVPTVLALSEFFSSNFPNISWYPNWYLGNPYHYLIGPVVPAVLSILNFKDQISNIYLGLIFGSLVLGGFGLYLLLKDWGVSKSQAIVSGILYAVLPAGVFLLNFQNGLNHIAFGILPFALLLFKKFLVKENKLLIVLLTLTTTIMLLTSVSILLPLVIGFMALFVSIEHKDYPHEKIGKTILMVLLSISVSTLWYTPKFWWVITANPSLGGVPLGKLGWSILQFLLQFLPLVLAIFVVKLKKFKPQGYLLFGLLFFTSFLFLSIVRFISDPDFVMDWIGFGLELQFGLAIIMGHVFLSSRGMHQTVRPVAISKRLLRRILLAMTSGIIFVIIVFNLMIVKSLLENFSNNFYQDSVISMLKKNVKDNERVFLSGSSVFFINSKINIQQVRGGVDQSSINPFWADGAYQIREGTSANLAYDWLRALGASYILVHDKDSKEPFHDFKHAEKFADSLSSFTLISVASNATGTFDSAAEEGNNLYKVNSSPIGRVADASILNVQKPKNGADNSAIKSYILSFKRPLEVNSPMENQKPNEIVFEENIKQGEVISLAYTYDKLWNLAYGKGVVAADSLGNMAIIPKNTGLQRFKLTYNRNLLDLGIPLGLSILIVVILVYYQKIVPYFKRRFPKLHVGLGEEED